MEPYQKLTSILEEKLTNVKLFNYEILKKNKNEKCVKQIADITDEEG